MALGAKKRPLHTCESHLHFKNNCARHSEPNPKWIPAAQTRLGASHVREHIPTQTDKEEVIRKLKILHEDLHTICADRHGCTISVHFKTLLSEDNGNALHEISGSTQNKLGYAVAIHNATLLCCSLAPQCLPGPRSRAPGADPRCALQMRTPTAYSIYYGHVG